MLDRDAWLPLARKLDWTPSHAAPEEVFPPAMSGIPWLPQEQWADWEEPYRTTYREYVRHQSEKEASVRAVRELLGHADDLDRLPPPWRSSLKLHAATLALAEHAAVVGNLRGARFGRDGAWRTAALLGALDELRHTQIPLAIMHELVRADPQFDWTHRLYHSDDWVAIAARHFADDLLLGSSAVDFALGTHFVLETGFTNLQFLGLAALARRADDHLFEKMASSIQTDEARHAQIGQPVLEHVARADPARAQELLDRCFWRSWLLFAVITGFSVDYLTPLPHRAFSFKEFVEEWVLEQYVRSVEDLGLKKPWYWDTFLDSLDHYHHMVYASAYTYRFTVWFDLVVPGPDERAWLRQKYPRSWDALAPVWEQISERWRSTDAGNELSAHGTALVGFCHLCQLVLCGGRPGKNTACILEKDGQKRVFCSEPCRWIFERQSERYARHRDLVTRVLEGEAPANLVALILRHFGLTQQDWGKDAYGGDYPWLVRPAAAEPPRAQPAAASPGHVTSTAGHLGSPIPLHGFLQGDTLGLLLLAHGQDTVAELAEALQRAASLRVRRRERVAVVFRGRVLDPGLTLEQAGLGALDRFDVVDAAGAPLDGDRPGGHPR